VAKALALLEKEIHHIGTRPIIQVDTGNGGLSRTAVLLVVGFMWRVHAFMLYY